MYVSSLYLLFFDVVIYYMSHCTVGYSIPCSMFCLHNAHFCSRSSGYFMHTDEIAKVVFKFAILRHMEYTSTGNMHGFAWL